VANERSFPPDLMESTKVVWSRKLRRKINDAEACEILRRFQNLILILREITGR
jgi:hypothetical protein